MSPLPRVLVTSVFRGSRAGRSHGGVYLVDLEQGTSRQVLDWNTQGIDWSGRGGARGLRGIAFYDSEVWMAASDELFVYDKEFKPLASYFSPFLKHCHEICRAGDTLYVTSTGHNAVLAFDLQSRRFVRGYRLEIGVKSYWIYRRGFPLLPRLRIFDPGVESQMQVVGRNSLHLNSVHYETDALYVTGTRSRHLFQIQDGSISAYGRIPFSTHNAQPFENGILANDTAAMQAVVFDRTGKIVEAYQVKNYPEKDMESVPSSTKVARQGFARGLVKWKDYFITGSSPATVNVFKRNQATPVKTVNISMNVRNTIHGLELWPY